MARRLLKRILKAGKPERFDHGSVLAIFRSRDTLHGIGIQILETDARDDIIGIALKRLHDLNAIRHRLGLMRKSDRLGQRVSALFGVNEIHERCGLDPTQTGRTQCIIAKLRGASTGGQSRNGQTAQQADTNGIHLAAVSLRDHGPSRIKEGASGVTRERPLATPKVHSECVSSRSLAVGRVGNLTTSWKHASLVFTRSR